MRLGIGHPGHKDRVTGHVLGDFAKADHEWLDTLLGSVADNAALLAENKDTNFMNKVALETGQNQDTKKPKPAKKQSHVQQARKPSAKPDVPKSGPMADMLKKLFGKDE